MMQLIALALAIAEPSVADTQALNHLAARMDEAWTGADPEANANLFVPDATARFGDEPLEQGRDAIRRQFESFFKDRPPGLRHVTRIERIERVGSSHALWDALVLVERKGPSGTWEPLTRIRNVTLAVRHADGWRVQAVRAVPLR